MPGFTGRLVVEYLTQHPERSSFTLSIAARSRSKLEELKTALGLEEHIQILQVDVTNLQELEDAVKQARVVINTVGPFQLTGTPVVASVAFSILLNVTYIYTCH